MSNRNIDYRTNTAIIREEQEWTAICLLDVQTFAQQAARCQAHTPTSLD